MVRKTRCKEEWNFLKFKYPSEVCEFLNKHPDLKVKHITVEEERNDRNYIIFFTRRKS